ncbi:hypothetical protein HY374_02600 [Candidatus Berkelbacteria bacterium]|nr:hypothetical protein [Candidatus Berkelbacteria bacterium]
MRELAVLGFALLLLFLTLSVAMTYLAGPMALARKTGVLRAGRWFFRATSRGLVGTLRVLTKTRRPRIRRPSGQPSMRRVR